MCLLSNGPGSIFFFFLERKKVVIENLKEKDLVAQYKITKQEYQKGRLAKQAASKRTTQVHCNQKED